MTALQSTEVHKSERLYTYEEMLQIYEEGRQDGEREKMLEMYRKGRKDGEGISDIKNRTKLVNGSVFHNTGILAWNDLLFEEREKIAFSMQKDFQKRMMI